MSQALIDMLVPADIRAVYLERWRADAIARQVWRLANGRTGWRSLSARPASYNSYGSHKPSSQPGHAGGNAAQGFGAYAGARYLIIEVEALAILGFEKHHLRLWGRDYETVVADLSQRQRDDLVDFLNRKRQAAIYAVHRTRKLVQRTDSTTKDLAIVFTTLLSHCELAR